MRTIFRKNEKVHGDGMRMFACDRHPQQPAVYSLSPLQQSSRVITRSCCP